jgi:hypothetical protein
MPPTRALLQRKRAVGIGTAWRNAPSSRKHVAVHVDAEANAVAPRAPCRRRRPKRKWD